MSLTWHWRGEELILRHDRTLWWPARRTLIVADVHLGKGRAMNRLGLPVPDASTADLARLAAALSATAATRIVFLGDLVHTPRDAPSELDTWQTGLNRILVAGNHDRAFHPVGFTVVPALAASPFILSHAPQSEPGTICGHLHPKAVLRDALGSETAPCFWLNGDCLVLPAFGAHTGGHPITPGLGDRVAVVGPDSVVEVRLRR